MNTSIAALALEHLDILRDDYHDYNPGSVPAHTSAPSPVAFAKIVSKGFPSVFQIYRPGQADPPWRACAWTASELAIKVTQPVEVALTPHGNADALVSVAGKKGDEKLQVFVQPAAQYMTMEELLKMVTPCEKGHQCTGSVHYLQSQNSNLTTTALSTLLSDLPSKFDFAEQVLGEPDARNIWIGDQKSVTSVHRDPYENLYLVLRGRKKFRLWAPVDEAVMPVKMVRTGRYVCHETEGTERRFEVVLDEDGDEIPWVVLDPLTNSEDEAMGTMKEVTVEQGQMLYLPSGWYHHVSQECGIWDDGSPAPCVAVNYWYDMDYEGEKYVMRQLIGRLVELARAP